ncbi:MAG: hypothetical protein ACTSRS_11370 [Candidatus Helarchaeota archaeon]
MVQGMKFRIFDKDHAEFEVRLPFHKVGGLTFVVIGLIIIILGIWAEYTFGPAWPLYILGGLVCLGGYFIIAHRIRLILDKSKGKATLLKNFWGIYRSIRKVWNMENIGQFEAKVLTDLGYHAYPEDTAFELAGELMEAAAPEGPGDEMADFHKNLSVDWSKRDFGCLIMHLKTGEIIPVLFHRFPNPPENCAKYGNLFLKGEDITPGVYVDLGVIHET